jgi:hypothetical protein
MYDGLLLLPTDWVAYLLLEWDSFVSVRADPCHRVLTTAFGKLCPAWTPLA